MAQVVYSRAGGNSQIRGTLFDGLKFFLAQRVPSRSSYVEKITSNGGEVVKLEQHADIIIADHIKANDAPPGSISYKFIDAAIREGALPDTNDDQFRCGPPKGEIRPVSSARPARNQFRVPFSAEDDRQLYQWVKQYEMRGGAVRGNEIYKQLEAVVSLLAQQSMVTRSYNTESTSHFSVLA